MAKGYTLDTRQSLYGEPRLSDAQVQLLAEISRKPGFIMPINPTRRALTRLGLVEARPYTEDGLINCHEYRATETGRKILAEIDAAGAP